LVRDNRLHMLTSMRSNDAWFGLPHDIFTFTILQELVARSLGLELGEYKHVVGSLHLYEKHHDSARCFLEEGWQLHRPMPPMPQGDPWGAVERLVAFEQEVRTGQGSLSNPHDTMEPYWADLATLLTLHKAFLVPNNRSERNSLKRRIREDVYSTYIKKRDKLASEKDQLLLFNGKEVSNKDSI
jgi:thymidylate synthase